ncbi:ATPase [Actinomycetota bacterium]
MGTTITDAIERSITIDAPRERVWQLISEPGWWINEGEIREHEIVSDGSVHRVTDSKHGTFTVETVEAREGEYAAYRWLSNPDADGEPEPTLNTLVEFTISGDGPVEVTVRESGFLPGDVPDEIRERDYRENSGGWEHELAAAKRHLEGAA